MVTLNEYQEFSQKSLQLFRNDIKGRMINAAFGICGESGEVVDIIKKGLLSDTLNREHLKEEMGDIIWYIAQLCDLCGFTLQDVLDYNVAKLTERYQVK